jgi:hypothetical protein
VQITAWWILLKQLVVRELVFVCENFTWNIWSKLAINDCKRKWGGECEVTLKSQEPRGCVSPHFRSTKNVEWLAVLCIMVVLSSNFSLETGCPEKFFILWRACCRQCGMCWQLLLGKHHMTCFLCGLTPACTQQWKKLLFSLWSGPAQQWKCFLCGLFPDYVAWMSAGRNLVRGGARNR